MSATFTRTQRIILGVVSAAMLLTGVAALLFFPQANPAVTAILIRVGTVLAVVWLAFPQLKSFGSKLPASVVGIVMITLVFMAARPNVFKIAAAAATVLIAVSALSKVLRK